ncbi:hypothetical protein D3C72_2181840 [compost metagenome]
MDFAVGISPRSISNVEFANGCDHHVLFQTVAGIAVDIKIFVNGVVFRKCDIAADIDDCHVDGKGFGRTECENCCKNF